MLVGGGGSGGPDLGGGGGGGGVISIPSLSISANTDYEIVVGDGGVSDGNTGGQGEDTTAFGATAAGSGTSGRHNNGAGTDGGSGGGADQQQQYKYGWFWSGWKLVRWAYWNHLRK